MSARALIACTRDERGAVALIAALSMTAVLGVVALVADLGAIYVAKRDLQAATDAAALSGTYPIAQDSTVANSWQTYAQKYLTQNIVGATVTSTRGIYCPNTSTSPGARYSANTTACADNDAINGYNAVKVTASITSPFYFGRLFMGGTASQTVSTSATAAQINEAGFYAGSGAASLNAGMVNAVLNGVLGGTGINLTAVQYQALLSTNIDALTFLNKLATNVGVTAGTYNAVLQSSATVQEVLQAEIDALNAPGSTASVALNALKASIPGTPSIDLGSLFDLGEWQNIGVGATNATTALAADLNVFQLASLAAQVSNGSHFVTIPNSRLGISGVATVTAASTVIEPPQGPAFVFAPVGTTSNPVTVHTAQVRLQLNLQLLSALSVNGSSGVVNLPIYVEVASGNAQLTAINCGYNPATDATVQISAQSGAAQAYVGTVSSTAMSNVSTPVSVTPATLINIPNILPSLPNILTVTASGEVSVGSPAATTLTFDQNDMTNLTAQTVTSTGMLGNLLGTLASSTTLNASLLGVSLPGTSSTLTSLNALLAPAFAGLDPLVDGLLAALGVKIGYMDVTATGARCGVPVLVN
jgi:uncharacterized membrane protein